MAEKPVLFMTYAANDLSDVHIEAQTVWKTVENHPSIHAVKLEDADIGSLAKAIIPHRTRLYFFHFSGHATNKGLTLDGNRFLDRVKFSRMLMPDNQAKHKLQWVFLNGCESFGHVGGLLAKGAKAVIATNHKVQSKDAVELADLFYHCFFKEKMTLSASFQYADTVLAGEPAQIVMTNPGEINEDAPIAAGWTLYVSRECAEIQNWTLDEFIQKGNTLDASDPNSASQSISVTGSGNTVISGVSNSNIQVNPMSPSANPPATPQETIHTKHKPIAMPNSIEEIKELIDVDLDAALAALDGLNWGNKRGTYLDLKASYVDQPVGFNNTQFRSKLKTLLSFAQLPTSSQVNTSSVSEPPIILSTIQKEAKDKIIKGTDVAIKFLEGKLQDGSTKDALSLLKANWESYRKSEMLGLMDFNQNQQAANNLRFNVMTFIDRLSEEDLL